MRVRMERLRRKGERQRMGKIMDESTNTRKRTKLVQMRWEKQKKSFQKIDAMIR